MRLFRKPGKFDILLLTLTILLSGFLPVSFNRQSQAASALYQVGFGYGIIAGESRYGLVRDMGFNWIKINLSWKAVQGTRGGPFDWASYDAAVNTARSQGFSILMRIDDSPQWASYSSQYNAPPVDDNDLAEFAYQVALHFRSRVQAYEIWNEPNIAIEWGGLRPDPGKFARMLKALYPRMKQADGSAVVVTGGLSNTGDGNATDAYGDLLYIKQLYDPNEDGDLSDGAKGYFDAIGSHPYGGPDPPEQDPWSSTMGTYFRRSSQHRQMMEVWGGEYKQIWATEFGYLLDPATDGLNCDSDPAFGWHFARQKVNEQQQADYLVRAFDYARSNWPWMGPMFLMSLDTTMDSFRQPCENVRFYAIRTSGGAARPAYTRLAQMSKVPPTLSTSTTQVVSMLRPSEANTTYQQITIANSGSGIISWSASPSSSWISLSPTSNLAPSTLTITLNKAGLPTGWTTGAVTVNTSAGTQTITVRLYVGSVWRSFVPTITRNTPAG